MKFVSWNVQAGKHLGAVTEMLAELNPDIIALQEVKDDQYGNTAYDIATRLGYQTLYFDTARTKRRLPYSEIGNAILSKLPIVASQRHTLSGLSEYQSPSATEPRNVGLAKVKVGDGTLLVASSQLAYSPGFERTDSRDQQVDRLLETVGNLSPLILGIGMNSEPGSEAYQAVTARLVNADADNTVPTWIDTTTNPLRAHRIDYILRSSDVIQHDFEIVPSGASDHAALVMNFSI